MAVAPTNTLKPQLLVLKEGDFVFEEGDEAIFAYVLTEGEIEILQTVKGEPHVLGKVEKGTVFGEMAIIDGFPRSASARAATESKVQEVGHKEFIDFISNPIKHKRLLINDMYKYIINFDKSQKKINVEFLKKIRDEKKFNGLDELKEQIFKDIAFAKQYFS